MSFTRSPWIAIGAINAVIAIAAGAFGAHALKATLDARRLGIFETASRYQMYHALALVLIGIIVAQGNPGVRCAAWAIQGGVIVFSGSLYLLALTDVSWLGAITPFGGVAMMVGWVLLAWKALPGT